MPKYMTPPIGNDRRVARAAKVLVAFRNDKFEDKDTTLVDLLADLKHWAKAHDVDFDNCLRIAHDHFIAEINGEE